LTNCFKNTIILAFLVYAVACKTTLLSSKKQELTYKEFSANQHVFQSKDGKMVYIDRGEGEVILLLHGVPTSSWLYRKMIDDLVNAGYRVIVPDMLGYGNSDSPKGYEIYQPKPHAERLLALMDSLEISHWTHVFHDAGGLWTWELLELAPDRINGLVILNSIIYPEGFHPPIRFNRGLSAKITMGLYRNNISTDGMLGMLFKEGLIKNELTENAYQGYKNPLLNGQTKGMYTFFTSTCNSLPDYSKTIKKVEQPSLIIWGKYDDFLRLKPMKERLVNALGDHLKGVHEIEAKHFIQEEKPKEISQLILKFMRD